MKRRLVARRGQLLLLLMLLICLAQLLLQLMYLASLLVLLLVRLLLVPLDHRTRHRLLRRLLLLRDCGPIHPNSWRTRQALAAPWLLLLLCRSSRQEGIRDRPIRKTGRGMLRLSHVLRLLVLRGKLLRLMELLSLLLL